MNICDPLRCLQTSTTVDAWTTAPVCPTNLTSTITYDVLGRPWAWASGQSCKVVTVPITFVTAPRCLAAPTPNNTVADKHSQLWCVFLSCHASLLQLSWDPCVQNLVLVLQ